MTAPAPRPRPISLLAPAHPRDPRVPRTLVDANRLWVDSWLRARAQTLFEARVLRRLGGDLTGARVLEIGTGRRGTGLRLAVDRLGAAHADGVELHPGSVLAARRAVADLGPRVTVAQGDAEHLPMAGASYDAVLDFHLLHHAQDWRAAVREAARVLRPGGRLLVAEMTARFVDSRALRAVSHHPADGDRPSAESLLAAVRDSGLEVLGTQQHVRGWWLAVAARKPGAV